MSEVYGVNLVDVDNNKRKMFRDKVAIEALNGMLAHARHGHGYHPRLEDAHLHWHDAIAKEAYEIADAMLSAREASDE